MGATLYDRPTGPLTEADIAAAGDLRYASVNVAQTFTDAQRLQALSNLAVPINCARTTFVSTTAIAVKPYNGDLLKINGLLYRIPAAGIAGVANTGIFLNGAGGSNLAASTTYYVYAFNNGGTVTADFRTGGHATSATAGNIGTETLSGFDAFTLVGMIRTNASSQFSQGLVRSWANRYTRTNVGAAASTTTSASTSLVELSTNGRVDFLSWSGEEVEIRAQSQLANSSSAQDVGVNIGIDGGTTGQLNAAISARVSAVTGSGSWFGSNTANISPSEGYHFINNLVQVSGGTGTFNSLILSVRMD